MFTLNKHSIKKISNAIFLPLSVAALMIFACSKSYNGGSNGYSNTTPVSIKNFAFSVSTLTVSTGTTVKWTNNDAATHTVTADDGSFDSGNMAPGASFRKTFNSPDSIPYHCNIHSSMKASVVIQ